MGPVNLLAIQEFQELEERHAFFEKQEKDLTDAIESLKETIRRINRTSRERFLEAFEAVRRNFNETFTLLFGGGRGDIRLMEDEDPLDCGLEINVQPPGKRLQSLMLLSGGEKALSPSRFCSRSSAISLAVLPSRRGGRRPRRIQRAALHEAAEGVRAHDAVHRHHAQQAQHGRPPTRSTGHDGRAGISKLVSVNLAEGGLAQMRAPRSCARRPGARGVAPGAWFPPTP
jgi:hypothetical protein